METFFFISLGITFLLILLLVYHFKQRLSIVEQKGDTMFDIINNMVKEMGVIKSLVMTHLMSQNPNSAAQSVQRSNVPPLSASTLSNTFSEFAPVQDKIMVDMTSDILNNQEEDDAEDAVDSEDDDVDDSEDDDVDDSEDDDDSDDEDMLNVESTSLETPQDVNKILVSDDETEIPVEDVLIEEPALQLEEVLDTEIETTPLDMKETESSEQLISEAIQSEISKIVLPISTETEIVLPISTETEIVLPISTETVSKEVYQKMSLQELKDQVLLKGLAKDVSKMKKPKLIELLTSY